MTDGERAEIYREAFKWFRLYPEFKPNPDRMAEWCPAVEAACALFDKETKDEAL